MLRKMKNRRCAHPALQANETCMLKGFSTASIAYLMQSVSKGSIKSNASNTLAPLVNRYLIPYLFFFVFFYCK